MAPKGADVGTSTKSAPGAGNHNDTNRGIELNVVQCPHNRGEQLVAKGVELCRPVHRQDRDGTAVVALQDGRSLSVRRTHDYTSLSTMDGSLAMRGLPALTIIEMLAGRCGRMRVQPWRARLETAPRERNGSRARPAMPA
jgi:hypothetical protein